MSKILSTARKTIYFLEGIVTIFLLIGIVSTYNKPLDQTNSTQVVPEISASPDQDKLALPEATISPLASPFAVKTSGCKMVNYLPDKECDPGAIDPAVTQENIGSTICKTGYTSTVRPSSYTTNKMKVVDMAAYGFTDSPSNYEYDHIIPLELGGAPRDTRNIFPQPYAEPFGARDKDKVENKLKALVCANVLTLVEAQSRIAVDWVSVLREYYP